MKKIVLLADAHTGSILPLAKRLILLGYFVDIYLLCTKKTKTFEAITLKRENNRLGIQEIDYRCASELYNYIDSKNFSLYTITYPRPYQNVPILRIIRKIILQLFFKNVGNKLNKKGYDYANLIGRSNSNILIYLNNSLKNTYIFTSLHEVCNHENPNFNKPGDLLKYLIEKRKKIIVHSKNSFNDIRNFDHINMDNVRCINFGLFETYNIIPVNQNNSYPENFILFYGQIRPYKGLKLLYEAVEKHIKEFEKWKIIIAGSGDDPILEKIKIHKNFLLINRFLSNEELIELNQKAYLIVCPYISISQSGIPQTSFLFNKPIIASNLGSFREIIVNDENGYLFDYSNHDELAEVLLKTIRDKELYTSMVKNIKKFELLHPEYSWDHISKEYDKMLNNTALN